MEKKTQILLIAILIIGIFYIAKDGSLFQNDSDTFKKKQECSQYYELANTKIKESGRVFQNDTYTLKEIFYSPKLDTCVYAYTINTPTPSIYSIDDVFGGDVFTGSISEEFIAKIAELK